MRNCKWVPLHLLWHERLYRWALTYTSLLTCVCSCMRLYTDFTRHEASINKQLVHLTFSGFHTQRIHHRKDDEEFLYILVFMFSSSSNSVAAISVSVAHGVEKEALMLVLFLPFFTGGVFAAANGGRKQCAALELLSQSWCECVRWKWIERDYALNFN